MLEEKLKQNLADNLIRLRVARGYTQEQMVLELNKKDKDIELSRTALAAYENQRSFPRLDVLYTISRFFDTDIESLLKEKEESGNALDHKWVNHLDLNELLHDYSEVLMYFKMYQQMYYTLAERVMTTFGTVDRKEEVMNLITGVHASVQLEIPGLKERFRERLDSREILVFQGIQNGISITELAAQLNTRAESIAEIFISAKEKVFNLFFED